MFTITAQTIVHSPLGPLFAYMANPQNIVQWRTDVKEVRNCVGDGSAGTSYDERINFMGDKIYSMRVEECVSDKRIVVQCTAGAVAIPRQTFEFATTDD